MRDRLARIAAEEGKQRLVLTEEPDWGFHYSEDLVIREALHRYHGGKPRLPEEVAAIPPEWDDDIARALDLLQFQRDALET